MSTFVEYLVCPICGKSTPLKKASYKVGDPAELGWIQVRECRGKKGFCTVETKTLRDNIKECQRLADELVDFCSGVLTIVLEENLKVHKPSFLQKYEQLQRQIEKGTPEEEEMRFQMDDNLREIKRLKAELKEVKDMYEYLSVKYDDIIKENKHLKSELKRERNSHEGRTFEVADLKRENQRLKDQNRALRYQLQSYEKASFR